MDSFHKLVIALIHQICILKFLRTSHWDDTKDMTKEEKSIVFPLWDIIVYL